jgi:protein-L-isoaspartate(D-aspartate) O-methyltransferase
MLPPPKAPTKSKTEFEKERAAKVGWLVQQGLLESERIKTALLKVPREIFIPRNYRDYTYLEVPLPLPGECATISCPHSYPLFYEPLGLDEGHRFLQIGTGSGYGAAVAREVVGPNGLVVSVEIDRRTLSFARKNLEKAGYQDVILARGDGAFGHPDLSPYDRIAITAACLKIPEPLLEQLRTGGRLIAPIIDIKEQFLELLEKGAGGIRRQVICRVLYVRLRGAYSS